MYNELCGLWLHENIVLIKNMYRHTDICWVNIMASAVVIVVTNCCVLTLYFKNWMTAKFYLDIKYTLLLKIYILVRNVFR